MISITTTESREVWREVDLNERGQFEILLKKPTWQELTEDSLRGPGYLEHRLTRSLIGWRGIEINGAAPEFSMATFQNLCEQVPAVYHIASSLISDLYYSFGEDEQKNSGEASSVS